jgi:spore maturation protein CgeB
VKVLLVGVGEFYHTGAFFERALKDLGHECVFLDEQKYVGNRLGESIAYRLWDKKALKYREFNRDLISMAAKFKPEVMLATKGSFISPEALIEMKRCSGPLLVNYATDDPFNRNTSGRHIVDAIPHYDVYICTKRAIMEDVRRAGCSTVIFVPFGYEPSMYYPEQPLPNEEHARFRSDVAFIGGADADRYPFFEALADAIPGLDLHLYGGYWDRHPRLKKYHRGFATGRDYRLVIAGTKIAPCLVRRANRDGHVMRTFEVPACGGFMLHERTLELPEFYQEDKEVACFGSAQELAEKTQYYLAHPQEREAIARAGHARCVPAYSYDNRIKEILGYHGNRATAQVEAVAVGG